MIAINTIRREPHYRRQAFDAGLESLGYRLEQGGRPHSRSDLLLTWNRHSIEEHRAAEWEAQGGTVIVCENGYLSTSKGSMYAISVHGHCGSGWFPVGHEDRFSLLGVQVSPWRHAGDCVLVCGQRGIGSRHMASPRNWEITVGHKLRAMGVRNVKIRRHPGRYPAQSTLESDLQFAGSCVIWSSACGVQALVSGIPVAYCAPHWICSHGASKGLGSEPLRSDAARSEALHRMSHGQWAVDEIARGEPFRRILERIGEASW